MLWTIWIAIGSISAGLAVGFGAFGAHALKERLIPEMLAVYETAARYQMYHALAIIAVGFVATRVDNNAARVAGGAFIIGTLLFSGSLYGLALSGIRTLGMITPFGGVAFVIGWISLALSVLRP
jgi:uncharacterized membrane protein YgdD (TMEM256/DUF423 family)